MGYWDLAEEVANHRYRCIRIDDLESAGLSQLLAITKIHPIGHKAGTWIARIVIGPIDAMVGSFGECLLGIIRYDQTKKPLANLTLSVGRFSFISSAI